jgi:hypothetical protein
MHIDDAIAFVCGDICLKVHSVLPHMTKQIELELGDIKDDDHTTWLAAGAKLFTVIKQTRQTLVYCHENDYLYYASPDAELSQECPENHAILVQVVEDRVGSETLPRLLAFDMVYPPNEDPRKRGEVLRSLSQYFPPSYHVQWAGQQEPLRKFLEGDLPHEVETVIALGNTLQIRKEMRGKRARKIY